jgi:hypothetical protein
LILIITIEFIRNAEEKLPTTPRSQKENWAFGMKFEMYNPSPEKINKSDSEIEPKLFIDIENGFIEVEGAYKDFVPPEFEKDPIGYFEREGRNIKEGELKRDRTGKVREDPTATKYLPTWKDWKGNELNLVGKRINTQKAQMLYRADPFHEYDVIKKVNELGLPAAKPVMKLVQGGTYMFITEKIPGFRFRIRNQIKQTTIQAIQKRSREKNS